MYVLLSVWEQYSKKNVLIEERGVTESWRKLHKQELQYIFSIRYYQDNEIKENKMDETYSTHVEDKIYVQNLSGKIWKEEIIWEF